MGFRSAAARVRAGRWQTDYSKVEIKLTDLGHRTYMLEGAGGNITLAVSEGRHHHGRWPIRAAA